jgi:uncharacterized protein YeaO (DUF488 family)
MENRKESKGRDGTRKPICAVVGVAVSSIRGIESASTIHDLDRAMKAAHDKGYIRIKRVYDSPSRGDGRRVLVDRLWPRGLSKKAARVDEWFKDLAPSGPLRKWFGHDPSRWAEFQRRYKHELDARHASVDVLRALAVKKSLTLLYGARDEAHNNAVVLLNYLTRRKPRKRKKASS